jgi:hypothetical protein
VRVFVIEVPQKSPRASLDLRRSAASPALEPLGDIGEREGAMRRFDVKENLACLICRQLAPQIGICTLEWIIRCALPCREGRCSLFNVD